MLGAQHYVLIRALLGQPASYVWAGVALTGTGVPLGAHTGTPLPARGLRF
jgi:hypothetical protein